MTNVGHLVQRLVERGFAVDEAAEIINQAFVAGVSAAPTRADAAAERRRMRDREYQAGRRRQKSADENQAETSCSSVEICRDRTTSADEAKSPLYLPSSDSKDIKKEEKKERARGKRLPTDWKPNESHVIGGLELGYSEVQIFEQAEDMRLWAQSNEHRAVARKSNWDLAFSGWLRRNKPKEKPNERSGSIIGALDKMYSGSGSQSSPSNILRLQKG